MDNVNVLLTGCCSKGVTGIIKSLRQDPRIRIIGVDANIENVLPIFENAIQIPNGLQPSFQQEILHISELENIDFVLPQVTNELIPLSILNESFAIFDTNLVLTSHHESITLANNKELLFKAVKSFVPIPDNFSRQICAKPKVGNGGKGFRMLAEFDDVNDDEVLMEYLPGEEYSVDVLVNNGTPLKVIVRTRDKVVDGLSVISTVVENKELEGYCEAMVKKLNLHGIVGFQFKEDSYGQVKLLECNPRVQSGVELCTAAGYNMLTNAVKLALGEPIEDTPIRYGTKMIRYYESLYI